MHQRLRTSRKPSMHPVRLHREASQTTSNGTIHQAAVLPCYRGKHGIKVCLINRRHSLEWGFPKGSVEPGESPPDAALREAFEEAGLKGRIVVKLGSYKYVKKGTTLNVVVFLMEVSQVLSNWLEATFRKRRWVALDECSEVIRRKEMHNVLKAAGALARRMGTWVQSN